jgi:vanillate O-demethylase monooxygenase subunit
LNSTPATKNSTPATKSRAAVERPDGCSFEAGDWDLLAGQWFPVATVDELRDAPIAARLLDVDLVLYRSGTGVTVALDRCPHRGMRLSRGRIERHQLICPYHGLHFGGDGRCTGIPSRPDAVLSDRLSLAVVAAVERFGLIWVSLRGEEPRLPRFEAWDSEDFFKVVCNPIDIAGSAGRQIEGFLDVSHFAWAHTTTFGDGATPIVPDYAVEPTESGFRAEYLSQVSNYAPDQRHLAPADFVWRRHFEVFAPFTARLVIDYPEARQLWLLNAASPVSARQTRMFCPLARNFDLDGSAQEVRDFNDRVFNEDRILVENQRPRDLPLDASGEVSIPADRSSVAYRRLLKGMGLKLTYAGPATA